MPEAIAAYYREIELDPNYSAAGAYINLGNVLKEWGKVDDAVAAYRKAIEINQPYALVAGYYSLGIALSQQNKLDEAAAVFRKGIEINQPAQGLSALHRGLGDVLLQQNKYDEAIVAYRMAIKLQPDSSPRSHCNLAWALATRPEPHLRDPKQAVALAKRAVEQTPDSLTWQYLGWVLYRTGDWKASIEALEKSCKLQEGGSGDYGQWIVLALAHAKLAAQEGLPEKERELHRTEARRRFDEAGKQIDSRWRARPSNVFVRAVWDFREEARELMGAKKKKKK
jgi:tetratricopeptide (TPR) repeat protein